MVNNKWQATVLINGKHKIIAEDKNIDLLCEKVKQCGYEYYEVTFSCKLDPKVIHIY